MESVYDNFIGPTVRYIHSARFAGFHDETSLSRETNLFRAGHNVAAYHSAHTVIHFNLSQVILFPHQIDILLLRKSNYLQCTALWHNENINWRLGNILIDIWALHHNELVQTPPRKSNFWRKQCLKLKPLNWPNASGWNLTW